LLLLTSALWLSIGFKVGSDLAENAAFLVQVNRGLN
jgi:hypothetical protein